MTWDDLEERQQKYLQAVYEVNQEQEAEERGMWKHGVFDGVGSTLYTKLYLRKLIDERTSSTFNALEKRGNIKCKCSNQIRLSHLLLRFA